jgi:hypothetical protein
MKGAASFICSLFVLLLALAYNGVDAQSQEDIQLQYSQASPQDHIPWSFRCRLATVVSAVMTSPLRTDREHMFMLSRRRSDFHTYVQAAVSKRAGDVHCVECEIVCLGGSCAVGTMQVLLMCLLLIQPSAAVFQQRRLPKTRIVVRYRASQTGATVAAAVAAAGATDAGPAPAAAAVAAVTQELSRLSSNFKRARALRRPNTFLLEAKDEAGAAQLLARVRALGK